jgi:hypothetical protein
MEVPMKMVVRVITSDDPTRKTGQIRRTAAFVEESGL